MIKDNREIRGKVPKDLKIAFDIACARLEMTQYEALEEAIRDWLVKNGLPTSEPSLRDLE